MISMVEDVSPRHEFANSDSVTRLLATLEVVSRPLFSSHADQAVGLLLYLTCEQKNT